MTTIGRKTGKRRRKCVRAIRRGDEAFLVAMKGVSRTAWVKNALANPDVRLRIRGGAFDGAAREPNGSAESEVARDAYCEAVNLFDFFECAIWLRGRPTRAKIQELHRSWFEQGTPLVIELSESRG